MGKLSDSLIDQEYGTPPHQLHRRGDPETSVAAAYSVDTTQLEKLVHQAIISFGQNGCIADEVRQKFPTKPYSSITARFKALEDKNLITCGPDKRAGNSTRKQRVMRAVIGS